MANYAHNYGRPNANRRTLMDISLVVVSSLAVFWLAATYDILERLIEITQQHEEYELDEIITVSLYLMLMSVLFSIRRIREVIAINAALTQSNRDLNQAVAEIKQLRGILPICAWCKNIRDDAGFWHQVEAYVGDHSHVAFTHSLCPTCAEKMDPTYDATENNTDVKG